MKERQSAIVEYVSSHGKVEVNCLASHFNTSQVTIRKDLDYLSEKGFLKRERGYAVPMDPDDINYRMAFHYEEKVRIAKAAAEEVSDGETVMIEAGSACVLFAEQLARMRRDITIITNSIHLAVYIQEYDSVSIVLLGGNYQKKRQAVLGPMTKSCISEWKVDKIFVGTDGYSRELGFTGSDVMRADTLKTMIQSANHVYVLAESEKFQERCPISFLKFEDVNQVITDGGVSKEEVAFLTEQGIGVVQAEG